LQRGLPVHRLPGGAGTAVFADSGELETWLKSGRAAELEAPGPQNDQPVSNRPASNRVAIETPDARRTLRHRAAFLFGGFALAAAIGAGLLLARPAADRGSFAAVLGGETTAASRHQPPAQATQLYMTGIYHWNTRTPDGIKQALGEFRQALALDPGYAAAHAGLANAYNLAAQYGVMPAAEAYPQAKDEAERAIALDATLADGYSALAFATFYGFKDLRRAETLFTRALALDPKSSCTFHWYALMMMHTGRFDEPLRAITRAQELDPQSRAILANRGLILFYAGRTEEAIAVLDDLTRSAPDFLSPHYYLATIYLDQQRYDDYLRESAQAAALEGNAALKAEIEAGGTGYRSGGAKGLFSAILAVQRTELAAGKETAFNVARTAALLGDSDTAFASLQQSLAAGEPDLLGLRIDRSFKALYGDARFQTLAANVLDVGP
jgi:tetratricopeptide (TPR) repeat protein